MGRPLGREPSDAVIAEIVGLPGSGKTTLNREMVRTREIASVTTYRTVLQMPRWLHSRFTLQRIWSSPYGPAFGPQERVWMMRLESAPPLLRRAATKVSGGVVIDQGPAFTLSRLRIERVPSAQSPLYCEWWETTTQRWRSALDVVIMLDASNACLLERIHTRGKSHVLLELSLQDAKDALDRERALYEEVIAGLCGPAGAALVRLNTECTTVVEAKAEVEACLSKVHAQRRHLRSSLEPHDL